MKSHSSNPTYLKHSQRTQQPQAAADRPDPQSHAPKPTVDQAPPPTNEPVIYLPPTQAELEEAARTGQAQDSALLGANVPAQETMAVGEPPTAGDPDAMGYQAQVVGEEAIGGTTPTPDQNNVDDIAAAVGISTKAEHPVGVKAELDRRDAHRFELDPESQNSDSSV